MAEPGESSLAGTARVGGMLFTAASFVNGVLALLDPGYANNRARVLVMCLVGTVLGTVYLGLCRWAPRWLVYLMPPAGGLTLCMGMVVDHNVVVGGELLLVWPLFAAYLLPRWVTVVTLATIVAVFPPVVISILGYAGITPSINMTATLVIATLVFGSLRRRNDRLVVALREQALTDGLTGLPNRRAFTGTLDAEIARTRRSQLSLSLAVVDVDLFKRINDSAGHAAGDSTLCDLGRLLRGQVRSGDTVARVGGEEFVVLLPGCPAGEALLRTDALRRAVAESSRAWAHPITISAGVATLPDDAVDADGLLVAADRALYLAKERGRNRVVGASSATGHGDPGVVGDPSLCPDVVVGSSSYPARDASR